MKSIPERIWAKDPSLWPAQDQQNIVQNCLGWLHCFADLRPRFAVLEKFVASLQAEKFQYAVLLGMGGSSLAALVLREVFGVHKGYLDLRILDTTNPDAIGDLQTAVDLQKTIFLVASKSGTTVEVSALYKFFAAKVAAKHFVAITDPQTPLEKLARAKGFREVFLNPPDIGGRYAALSFFGLLPAALLGVDLMQFIRSAEQMAQACRSADLEANPGYALGSHLASQYRAGKYQMLLRTAEPFASLGLWMEQLVAESLGKQGMGILPVPQAVGKLPKPTQHSFVIEIALQDEWQLAGEMFRWEFATAIAGQILQINPFDQPNVQESKDKTNELLQGVQNQLAHAKHVQSLEQAWDEVREFFVQTKPGDYGAVLAYLPPRKNLAEKFQQWCAELSRQIGLPMTFGWGPRYLHSTGQYHKGGPNCGTFVILTNAIEHDLSEPGETWSFANLHHAQALGDYLILQHHQRRVLHIHIT